MDDFKGLYCTGGALKQRIPGIIWANPLKMHGGVMRGLLSVSGSTRNTREIRHMRVRCSEKEINSSHSGRSKRQPL